MSVTISFLVSVVSMLIAFTLPVIEAKRHGFSIVNNNLSDISAGQYSRKAAKIFNIFILICSLALLVTSISIFQALGLWAITSYLMIIYCISLGLLLFFPLDTNYFAHSITSRIFVFGVLCVELLVIAQQIPLYPIFFIIWIFQAIGTYLSAKYLNGWTVLILLHSFFTVIFYFMIIYFLV